MSLDQVFPYEKRLLVNLSLLNVEHILLISLVSNVTAWLNQERWQEIEVINLHGRSIAGNHFEIENALECAGLECTTKKVGWQPISFCACTSDYKFKTLTLILGDGMKC